MNRLSLGALAALAVTQVAGCVASNNHDDAYITVNWQLKNVGATAYTLCHPDYDTVAFYSQEVDANGDPFGQQYIDLFPCSAGTATSAPLPPSTYVSWIEITNSNNTSKFAKSLAAYVDVTFEDKFFDAAIFLDGGYFKIDWDLASVIDQTPLQCSTAPDLDSVEVTAFIASPTDSGEIPPYPCEDHTAITPVLPANFYSVVIQAMSAGGIPRSEGVQLNNREIQGPNVVTPLGAVTLLIDPPL